MPLQLRCLEFAFLLVLWSGTATHGQQMSLAGKWRFAIDRADQGMAEKWFNTTLSGTIALPGSMTQNGKGDDITLQTNWTGSIYDSSFFFRPSLAKYRQPGRVKIPFWLTPNKHYVGAAWYQRQVVIPAGWHGRRIVLFLERCHFQSRIWIDGKEAGQGHSLVAPHQFDLSRLLRPGRHVITIRVDNRLDSANVGPDSHSVSDHTQGNWNGIVGKMLLTATAPVCLYRVQVYPDPKNKTALVKLAVVNTGSKNVTGTIELSASSFNTATRHMVSPVTITFKAAAGDTSFVQVALPMGAKMQLWDEFDPALYRLTAKLHSAAGKDEQQSSFGMREVKADGNKIKVNGSAIYLRGDLNNCEFPLTGYAPMDTESWRRIYWVAKAHGFNHMRFHSWCPPEAAFVAADEAGFYLQPEGPTWPNHGTALGSGRFIDQYIYDETNRMEQAYGNHPSYCMLAAGNEPAGRNQASYLAGFVQYWQAKDPRRLYTGASVAMSWPLYPESDYMIKSGPRGLNWNKTQPETQSDYYTAIEKFTMPYVTHEMGQWCVFPDFREIKKYTGVTRARNFELFRDDLADHGMAGKAQDFLMASGKLQALCYKQEIEKSLRTKNGAGFQLLGLQDFPGQGTALIGVLNAFWQEKGYVSADEWKQFCNSTVPLSRIGKFTYTNDEVFEAAIEVCHYGRQNLQKALLTWTIRDDKDQILRTGQFPPLTILTGGNTPVGTITFPLSGIAAATRLNLEVRIRNTPFANNWHYWVYPASLPAIATDDVYYTRSLDSTAVAVLEKGGKVLLNAAGKVVKGREIVMQFLPVFWNTSWFKMRPPHVLGFVAAAGHPLFRDFPTAGHSDLQWWEIVNSAQVMHLEDFPDGFQPVVQPIDTWFMNRKLALIMEMKVGNGKLLVSSANIADTSSGPAARQLLYSIRNYMASTRFNPTQPVPLSRVKDLFETPSREVWNSFTNATPDELKPQQMQTPR